MPAEVEENDYDSDDASKAALEVSAARRLLRLPEMICFCSSFHSHSGISGVQPALRAGEPHPALLHYQSQGNAALRPAMEEQKQQNRLSELVCLRV